jgi:myo-inositol-1-phosphate synthase
VKYHNLIIHNTKNKEEMDKIRVAIIGIGNCTSSLLQGLYFYGNNKSANCIGVMHQVIGKYHVSDIEVVAAFDVDKRKVGLDVSEAIFAKPNCTTVFYPDVPNMGVKVMMGKILDGVSEQMIEYPDKDKTFVLSDSKEPSEDEIVEILKDTKTDILLNYLPVGSEEATRFYATCALNAGVAFINNIPVFIASDPVWENRFREKNIPIIGDDIKAQVGATIVHRVLSDLFRKRGCTLDKTYQLNCAGNTDFLNMKIGNNRLVSKKISKTEAVQSVVPQRMHSDNIHVGPSDFIAWKKDNKICNIVMEGKMFGDVPFDLELKLSVEDSPNSAGVAIDAIRITKLALERKIGGALFDAASFFCKHPPIQHTDDEAYNLVEKFINNQ